MKIKITESQFRRVINEVGGYDDKDTMQMHAQNVQVPLLQSFGSTVEFLNGFIILHNEGELTKNNILNFIEFLQEKLTSDIEIINKLGGEIYIDNDFRDIVNDYKKSLLRVQNYMRILYSENSSMALDMTKEELSEMIIEQIYKLNDIFKKLGTMFGEVHSRYRKRLGFN